MNGENRIMIFGPKDDGTYVVGRRRMIRHFQERMPYGLFVPEVE